MKKKNGSKESIEEFLKTERETKDNRLSKKILVVRLVFEGYSVQEAAHIANCCEKTVYNNLNKYEEGGILALYPKHGPGRSKKLTDAQEEVLYDTIKNKLPNQVGFAPFANWTSSLAAKWIEREFGVVFSGRGVRNIFERLGLSYTRPTYTLKKADPEKQESFINEFEKVKKTDF